MVLDAIYRGELLPCENNLEETAGTNRRARRLNSS